MPLVESSLELSILRLLLDFQEPRERSLADVRERWSSAYHDYARLGVAGAGGTPTLSPGPIASAIGVSDFVSELSTGVTAYWMSAVWRPDGTFAYVTASASGLQPLLAQAFVQNALPSSTTTDAARRIARALHTYTTKLVIVTATNIQSGATAPVFVV